MPKKTHPTTYDLPLVRSAAAGRWPEILSALGGVDRDSLDGKHGPCPKCGGTDRFRAFTDDSGGCHCNQCFSTKNGDGFSTLTWLTGKDFGGVLKLVADYLNILPSANGHTDGKESADPAEHLEFVDWHRGNEMIVTAGLLRAKPGITLDAIKSIGGRFAKYRKQYPVIALPVYDSDLIAAPPVGYCLYSATGGLLPKWSKPAAKGEKGQIEWVKTKLTHGSKKGLIGQVGCLSSAAQTSADDPNGAIQIKTVWKCEGPSDCLSLIAVGLPESHFAITNANGAGEKPEPWMLSLLAGHRVYVIHDADKPGQDGATRWAAAIAPVALEVRNVRLPYPVVPDHGPDLRDYLTTDGKTAADVLSLAESAEVVAKPEGDGDAPQWPIEEDDRDPHRLADIFLTSTGPMKFWREVFMRFDSSRGCYVIVPRAQLNASINISCKTEFNRLARLPRDDDKEPKVNSVSRSLVNNVLAALEGICLLPDDVEPNTWLGDTDHARGPKLWISMANGILRLDDLLADADDVLQPHSPLWFSPIALPYEFIPGAECPIFTSVIAHNQENDADRIALLQEWAGYILTPSTDQQKFMVLEGEGANGKSVYLAVLQAMVGRQNVSSIPLESFDGRFDLTQTLGKLLNVAADASEIEKAAEGRVKSFVSGDTMYFDRKGISGVDAQPTARLIVSANNRPRFSDRSSGIWRRMMVVPWNKIIADDDPRRINGADKPAYWESSGELPGIFWWAVEGLARLRSNGRFTVPAVSASCLDDYRTESNPARAFLLEFYCEANECYVVNKEMYGHYKEWCKENGYHPLSDRIFGREVKRMFRNSEKKRARNGFELEWRLNGIGKSNPQI